MIVAIAALVMAFLSGLAVASVALVMLVNFVQACIRVAGRIRR